MVPFSLRLTSPRRHPSTDSFSLVEMTLALGIFSFAIISVIGLMTVGLKASQESKEETLTATIAKNLSMKVQAHLFTNGVVAPSATNTFQPSTLVYYYDRFGLETTSAGDPQYQANVTISAPAPQLLNNISSSHLLGVKVDVGWPYTSGNPPNTNSYTYLIARPTDQGW